MRKTFTKQNFFCISKFFLSLITIPLWFIKMLGDTATLPDRYTGKLVEFTVWHSMFENFDRVIQPCIPYFSIAVAIISAIINAFALKYRSNKLNTVANVSFGIAIGFFLILLFLASTVSYDY
ncbi:MAG: hypothetical protein E7609_04625 [Ruminococcaceae bacterium]|nr:hypothetical protein [Oscillospiraceae bacterium]